MGRLSSSPSTVPFHGGCPLADLFQQPLKALPCPRDSHAPSAQPLAAQAPQWGAVSSDKDCWEYPSLPAFCSILWVSRKHRHPGHISGAKCLQLYAVSTGTGCSTSLSPSACQARSWFQSLCFCTFPGRLARLSMNSSTGSPRGHTGFISSASVLPRHEMLVSLSLKRERVCFALHPGETPQERGKINWCVTPIGLISQGS